MLKKQIIEELKKLVHVDVAENIERTDAWGSLYPEEEYKRGYYDAQRRLASDIAKLIEKIEK
jgi:hypothetical protein